MQLEGSCHCKAVSFTIESRTPYPFMRCYCSICRKTGGGGGYAINIMGEAATHEVKGTENLSIYQATRSGGELSEARRHFCKLCGSALWLADPRWEQWVWPFASAIDTPLPKAPEYVNIMLDYAVPWSDRFEGPKQTEFAEYPAESIEDWHKKRGLYDAE
ncbi:MAG: GFA family protein [Alphaproteobacteria bacterium]|nr:GFA family protein [Alphaproteobacteria bacterium]